MTAALDFVPFPIPTGWLFYPSILICERPGVAAVGSWIFADPTCALDRAWFEGHRIYGVKVDRRMTWRTFRKAVDRLCELGIVEGDRVADRHVLAWESCRRVAEGGASWA